MEKKLPSNDVSGYKIAFFVRSVYIECMPAIRLQSSDREFFGVLAEVVYGNPFIARRDALIARLAPGAPPSTFGPDGDALARVVARKVEAFGGSGPVLYAFGAEDRRLVEPALLYVVYHRYLSQMDPLIERQARGGPAPAVPFADEVIADLVGGGYGEEEAVRLFALYYQLRRAFYFIWRSLAGQCESMRRLREALWNNVVTHDMHGFQTALWNRMEDFSTLIFGETGTGKGQAAAVVGRSQFIPYLPAERRFASNFAESFISLNLSQFPETLIESELFGHRKGAFTGAVDHHAGVFERCNAHGALFLDEIGEVSVPVQIKLLQVLQDRAFTPLGGHEKKRFAGRVIAATNRPIEELRREGRFRDDFFYRLCSDVIVLPTLRQRISESPAELEQLVKVLVARVVGDGNDELYVKVMTALQSGLPRDYAWPGNVRELEQAVRRVLLTGVYQPSIAPAHAADEDERLAIRLREGRLTAEEVLSEYCALLYRRLGSYAAVAERTGLDPRTSRKYVLAAKEKA